MPSLRRQLARGLRRLAARLDGPERFHITLPITSPAEAAELAKTIRLELAKISRRDGGLPA